MSLWLLILLPLAALALLETGARLYHRIKYLVPFHSKVIGEYPYSQFLEETGPPRTERKRESSSSASPIGSGSNCAGKSSFAQ